MAGRFAAPRFFLGRPRVLYPALPVLKGGPPNVSTPKTCYLDFSGGIVPPKGCSLIHFGRKEKSVAGEEGRATLSLVGRNRACVFAAGSRLCALGKRPICGRHRTAEPWHSLALCRETTMCVKPSPCLPVQHLSCRRHSTGLQLIIQGGNPLLNQPRRAKGVPRRRERTAFEAMAFKALRLASAPDAAERAQARLRRRRRSRHQSGRPAVCSDFPSPHPKMVFVRSSPEQLADGLRSLPCRISGKHSGLAFFTGPVRERSAIPRNPSVKKKKKEKKK